MKQVERSLRAGLKRDFFCRGGSASFCSSLRGYADLRNPGNVEKGPLWQLRATSSIVAHVFYLILFGKLVSKNWNLVSLFWKWDTFFSSENSPALWPMRHHRSANVVIVSLSLGWMRWNSAQKKMKSASSGGGRMRFLFKGYHWGAESKQVGSMPPTGNYKASSSI